MGRRTLCIVVTLLIALGLAGGAGTARGAAPSPMLRVVHASPGAPALDVYVANQKVATAMKFGDVTPYVTVPTGTYRLQVLSTGASLGGTSFIDANVDLREGAAYTVVAADRPGIMTPVLLTDEPGTAAGGQAHVRLVHASPDAPPVADVAVSGGPVVAKNLPFKGATDYLGVAPGTYRFEVRPAGTTQAVATTDALAVAADHTYTAFVIGLFSDNTFHAMLVPDNAASGGIGTTPSTGGGGMAARPMGGAAGALLLTLLLAACGGYWRRWQHHA
jgi:hypothetical protein